MNTQPILAYDCACVGASVALRVNGHTTTATLAQAQQAAQLIPTIDALLRAQGVAYADLGAIVTTTGPGSFTGVRIGLAALHGFVVARATPIRLLTTLEAIAWQVAGEVPRFTVTLRAGKGEVYAQDFAREGGADGRPEATSAITLAPETHTDWALPVIAEHAAPSAAVMAQIAHLLPNATLAEAIPHYIRPPDAALPKPYAWLAN